MDFENGSEGEKVDDDQKPDSQVVSMDEGGLEGVREEAREGFGFHYPRGHHRVNTTDDDHYYNDDNCNNNNNGMIELATVVGSNDRYSCATPQGTDTGIIEQQDDMDDDIFQDEIITTSSDDEQRQQHQHSKAEAEEEETTTTTTTIIGSARTPWYFTTIILLSEVMGTGILSLPYAAKTLGWINALLAVPLFAIFATYSGWLLSHVKLNSSISDGSSSTSIGIIDSYATASTILIGKTFGTFTKYCMLLNWGATAIYYLIATADGINDILLGATGSGDGSDGDHDGDNFHDVGENNNNNIASSSSTYYYKYFFQCPYQRTFLAAILLLLPCQCRDFHSISKYLSIPSTLAILTLVIVVCSTLWLEQQSSTSSIYDGDEDDNNITRYILFDIQEEEEDFLITNNNNNSTTTTTSPSPTTEPPTFASSETTTTTTTIGIYPGTTVFQYLESLSAFVFAYQGQSIYFELMNEMSHPKEFPKACYVAYCIMCVIYGSVVIIVYGLLGVNHTPEFLPDSLSDGTFAKQIVGVLVVLHICVSYVIACQPLHMYLHSNIFPSTYQQTSVRGNIHWFCVTFGYIVVGYIIGNLIPYFADVQALIGSLFGAAIIFGYPSLFIFAMYYYHNKNNNNGSSTIGPPREEGYDDLFVATSSTSSSPWRQRLFNDNTFLRQMGYKHVITCSMFLLVCTPLFCILGTSGAIQSIVQDTQQTTTKPFQC